MAKPIDPNGLFSTVAEWVRPRQGLPVDTPAAEATEEPVATQSTVSDPKLPAPAPDSIGALSAIEGLDVDVGLKRLMGKQDFYESLLRQFLTGEESRATTTVRQNLAEGDHQAAERTAHSLKGVAGTEGATELQARAAELERVIREEDPDNRVESQIASVDEELTRITTAIHEVFQAEETSDAVETGDVDWVKAREVAARLVELLESNDAGAIDFFEQSAPLLRAALGDAADSVQTPLTGWDLAGALEALRSAKESGAGKW